MSERSEGGGSVTGDETPERAPLISIKGDASPEEVAAVVAVFQALASAAASVTPPPRKVSRWSEPARMHRRPLSPGPGGWWASGLPR